MTGDVHSETGWADSFMRFLSIFAFRRIRANLMIFLAIIYFYDGSHLGKSDLAQVRAVGSHISDKTGFIKSLGNGHGTRWGEA